MTTVVIGGTAGLGLELARHRVAAGDRVVITGRDAERTGEIAASLGPSARGVAIDLAALPPRRQPVEVGRARGLQRCAAVQLG